MTKIFKYVLADSPSFIEMPKGARIVHVHEQGGNPCLWAIVDESASTEKREFVVVPTGGQVDLFTGGQVDRFDLPAKQYLGTVHPGSFVFHVFEVLL